MCIGCKGITQAYKIWWSDGCIWCRCGCISAESSEILLYLRWYGKGISEWSYPACKRGTSWKENSGKSMGGECRGACSMGLLHGLYSTCLPETHVWSTAWYRYVECIYTDWASADLYSWFHGKMGNQREEWRTEKLRWETKCTYWRTGEADLAAGRGRV